MLEPFFLKINMELMEGIGKRIDLLHEEGVSFASLWAEFFNSTSLLDLDEDTNQESLSFQYGAATFLVLAMHLADEYMEMQEGWEYDRTDHKWKFTPPVPPIEQED